MENSRVSVNYFHNCLACNEVKKILFLFLSLFGKGSAEQTHLEQWAAPGEQLLVGCLAQGSHLWVCYTCIPV